MKLKKLVYITGFVGIITCSLLSLEKNRFARNIKGHYENDCIHDGNVIAHRGFSSLEVENSFNSINRGFECNCSDGVEIDIRLTKDEEIVLSHDASISNIGKVSDNDLKELKEEKYSSSCIPRLTLIKACMFGLDGKLIYDRNKYEKSKKEYITTLDDVLENIDSNKILLVDIKFSDSNEEIFMEKIDNIFSNYTGYLDIILQSDNYDKLLIMKKKYPNYKYQLIIKNKKSLDHLDSDFEMFAIRKNLITKTIVENQIQRGKKLSVWTVNSCTEYGELKNKLDEKINDIFIITDYPDEICYLNNKIKKLKY